MAVGIVLTLMVMLLASAVALSVRRSAADAVAKATVTVRRQQLRWRRGGLVAGVVAAIACANAGGLGVGILLAAPLFGLFVIAGVLAGELSVKVPAIGTMSASVTRRTASLYLPRTLTRSVVVSTAVLGVTLIGTSLVGSPDDLGRAGRSLELTCDSTTSSATGPWPGTYYTVPLLLLLVIGLMFSVAAIKKVVQRARLGSSSDAAAADDHLRRVAAGTVVGAAGVLVSITLLGTSLTAGGALMHNSCSAGGWQVAGWALLASAPVWLAMLAASFAALNAGLRRRTVDA